MEYLNERTWACQPLPENWDQGIQRSQREDRSPQEAPAAGHSQPHRLAQCRGNGPTVELNLQITSISPCSAWGLTVTFGLGISVSSVQ